MAKKETVLQFTLQDGVTKTLRAIGAGLSTVNEQFANLNQTVELFGKGLDLVSTGFGFGPALVEAGQLEDILARVNSITGATAEQQVALQQAVIAASQATRFSAEEAAGALALLAEDGLSAEESIAQLGTVLQFAQANALSAAQAAQGLGAVLDTFGASANQIGPLADQLTAVARAAGTSTSALTEGLGAAGLAAQQAGLSIETTVTALGALAKSGLDGNAAGKQLTKILQELADPASKAGEAIKQLGLDGKSFAEVLQALGKDSKAAEQVLAALGDRPRAALRALLADGGGAVRELNQILRDSKGAAAEASEALQNTFLGALDQVTNALASARTAFLQPLLAPLAGELDALATKINEFAASSQFDKLRQQFAEFVLTAVESISKFIDTADFTQIAADIAAFGTKAAEVFRAIGSAAGTLSTIVVKLGEAFSVFRSLAETALNAVAGTAQKAAAGYVEVFNAITGGTEDSIAAARALQEASTESFTAARDASGQAGEKIAEFVGAVDEATAASERNRDVQAGAASALDQTAAAAEGVAGAHAKIGPAASAAADQVEAGAARQKNALIDLDATAAKSEAARAAAATAAASQSTASAAAAKDTAIQSAAAAQSTEKLAESTQSAASAAGSYSNEVAGAGDAAEAAAAQEAKLNQEYNNRSFAIGEASERYRELYKELFQLYALGRPGGQLDEYIRKFGELTNELFRQNTALQENIKAIRAQQAQYDPLQKEIEKLRDLYPLVGESALRSLAQEKQRLKELKEQAAETAKALRDANTTNAGGSFGGGNPQGRSQGNPQGRGVGSPQGGAAAPQNSGPAPPPIIIQAAIFDDAGVETLVRRIDKVQRRIAAGRI